MILSKVFDAVSHNILLYEKGIMIGWVDNQMAKNVVGWSSSEDFCEWVILSLEVADKWSVQTSILPPDLSKQVHQ